MGIVVQGKIDWDPSVGRRECGAYIDGHDENCTSSRNYPIRNLCYQIIPKSKDDFDAVENLGRANPEEIGEILRELLPWLQDLNWPIAKSIAQILSSHLTKIEDDLVGVLNGMDDIWKYWCIKTLLVNHSSVAYMPKLLKALDRVARSPTDGETSEGVNLLALTVLNSLNR